MMKGKKGTHSLMFILSQMSAIFVFAVLYWLGGKLEAHLGLHEIDGNGVVTKNKIVPIPLFDAFYFSLITQTTVGYGKMTPPSRITQWINIFQLLTIYGVVALSMF